MNRVIPVPDDRMATSSPVAAPLFREAMSRVAGAVHLIATDGPAGRAGLTATAMTSVSDDPPSLLVCLNRASRTGALLKANGAFSVNTLAAGQEPLADIFAGRTDLHGEARFAHGHWRPGPLGQPALADALASFAVRVEDIRPVATHFVVIGVIAAIGLGPDRPGLVYRRRAYRPVA